MPRTFTTGERSPLRFSALSARPVRRRPIRRTRSGRVLRFRIQPRPLHATLAERTGSCRLELRRLRSVARVRSVKPTRLMFFPHARGGPADRAALSLRRLDLAARAGHAPTRPLRAAFRYPHPGAVARPCRTSGPSLFLASSGGAPGVRSLRRFNPVYGWSRGASTAAKCLP